MAPLSLTKRRVVRVSRPPPREKQPATTVAADDNAREQLPSRRRGPRRDAGQESAMCVLRVDVAAGPLAGGRFKLSHLISGSRDPGPLTWAFDVAGSLLLKPS